MLKPIFFALLHLFGSIGFQKEVPMEKQILLPVRAVIFDIGKVVVHFDRQTFFSWLSKELNISLEESLNLYNARKRSTESQKNEDLFWGKYFESRNETMPLNWEASYQEHLIESIHLMPGIEEIIADLKKRGHTVAVLSNTYDYQAKLYQQLGIYDPFDVVVLSCYTGYEKPQFGSFQSVIAALQLSAEECVFIDDQQHNIDKANTLGFDGILFTSSITLKEELKKRQLLP